MADRYEIIKAIGKGSFGSVHLVKRRSDGSSLVMKQMICKNVEEKEVESFHNEVKLLTELSHVGIVSYVESFMDASRSSMYIIMGYCDGGDLSQFLSHRQRTDARLSENEALYHFVQMCFALSFMHDKNILHRDLKTQNIFIKNGLIQLGDLGISKALGESTDFASTCIGTPYYMSPELFKGKPYNHKSDVWALGCVLFELVTFKHAFDANSLNGLAQKIVKGAVPIVPTSFSQQLRDLIKSMLHQSPHQRPSIQQVLTMPFMKKSIQKYVSVVMTHRDFYRTADLNNFKQQLQRLGYLDMMSPPPAKPPVTRTPSNVSNQPVQTSPFRENPQASSYLRQVEEEERERHRLVSELARMERTHEIKVKALESRKERERQERDSIRIKKENYSNKASPQSFPQHSPVSIPAPISTAIAAAKEIARERERERERERLKKNNDSSNHARRPSEPIRAGVGAAKSNINIRRYRQDLDMKVANDKAELDNIKAQREALQRQMMSLENEQKSKPILSPTRNQSKPIIPSKSQSPTAATEKQKVLARKEQQRREREAIEVEKLRREREAIEVEKLRREREAIEAEKLKAARIEYLQDRIKAAELSKQQFSPSKPAAVQEQPNVEIPEIVIDECKDETVVEDEQNNKLTEINEDDDDVEIDEESIIKSTIALNALKNALDAQGNRIHSVRTSLQITALMQEQDIEEIDADSDETEVSSSVDKASKQANGLEEQKEGSDDPKSSSQTNSATQSDDEEEDITPVEDEDAVVSGSLDLRLQSLGKQCVKALGRDLFIKAYKLVQDRIDSELLNDSLHSDKVNAKAARRRWSSSVKELLGDKWKWWRQIDQLLFMESCAGIS